MTPLYHRSWLCWGLKQQILGWLTKFHRRTSSMAMKQTEVETSQRALGRDTTAPPTKPRCLEGKSKASQLHIEGLLRLPLSRRKEEQYLAKYRDWATWRTCFYLEILNITIQSYININSYIIIILYILRIFPGCGGWERGRKQDPEHVRSERKPLWTPVSTEAPCKKRLAGVTLSASWCLTRYIHKYGAYEL